MSQLDQTRFDVLQTSFEVVSQLLMPASRRQVHGDRFTVTLLVNVPGEGELPLDIHVDRLDATLGKEVFKTEDGTKVYSTTASILDADDGEKFDLNITIYSGDTNNSRPRVFVSDDFATQLRSQLIDQEWEQLNQQLPLWTDDGDDA